uniref:Uncharacterized protein n=1 Tax=Arion vulgaris TaxID=1028688 RepID=A0A0B6ZIV1_9EUPU
MSIIRVSAHAIRKLSMRNRKGCRTYTQVSQPPYKVEQPVVSQNKSSSGWAIPAALAVVGLGLSTFSTQQLVSGNDTVKMLSSVTTHKK